MPFRKEDFPKAIEKAPYQTHTSPYQTLHVYVYLVMKNSRLSLSTHTPSTRRPDDENAARTHTSSRLHTYPPRPPPPTPSLPRPYPLAPCQLSLQIVEGVSPRRERDVGPLVQAGGEEGGPAKDAQARAQPAEGLVLREKWRHVEKGENL